MICLSLGARVVGSQGWVNEVRQNSEDLETQGHGGIYGGNNKH